MLKSCNERPSSKFLATFTNMDEQAAQAASAYRTEKDSLGTIAVPAERLYGAQTARSLINFNIGAELMPVSVLKSLLILKLAAAEVNAAKGYLGAEIAQAIRQACSLLLRNFALFAQEFPLHVWQTGSGTQSNMNVNEVLANLATIYLHNPHLDDVAMLSKLNGADLTELLTVTSKVHPNDHVNCSQSSNDIFPSAMHLAAYIDTYSLQASLQHMITEFTPLIEKYKLQVKCGRTHLQDAVAITFGQEIGAWQALISEASAALSRQRESLQALALGGTACGTGLNAPKNFNFAVCKLLPSLLAEYELLSEAAAANCQFQPAANLFAALSGKTALANVHGALAVLAGNLFKIANDIRYLASGPRCGYGEINIPANEPGSSIMPGKVNPTQCEALTMVAVQVMANNTAISMANSQGQFQLNTYMPLIIYNFWQSTKLLQEAVDSFVTNLLKGLSANTVKMEENFHKSLMNVTALSPRLGYSLAAQIAKEAHETNSNLADLVIAKGLMTAEEYAELLDPQKLTYPHAET